MLVDLNMQFITLCAGANKLSKIEEQAEEYAALIMEELDTENLGYIQVQVFIDTFLNYYYY